jgi:hypothetical protein
LYDVGFYSFVIYSKKIFSLAPMGGIPFMAPPPAGFPPMGFNGPRF